MRLSKTLIVLPVLALLSMGCAPRHPCMDPHGGPCHGKPGMGMMMMHGCGPDACFYKSRCFSNGAVRSNSGVCQACSGGKWTEASGCAEHHGCGEHHGCDGHHCPGCAGKAGMKSAPCDHPCMHDGRGPGPRPKR